MYALFIFNNLNILFLFMMVFSSLLAVSSSNWLGAWMGLELNMLSFIPLIIETKNVLSNESALKYFLIQAFASSAFLMLSVFNSFSFTNFSFSSMLPVKNFLLMLPLLMKLGASPFQAWFISVMSGLSWFNGYLLMTWQKAAPLFILSYMTMNVSLTVILAIFSLISGSIGGLNQTSMRKIMGFSSLSHIGWLLSSFLLESSATFIYFLFYLSMNFMVVMVLKENFLFKFNQVFLVSFFPFSMSILSLGGLPPLVGFIPKWLILEKLVKSGFLVLSVVMVMAALITLIFYLRMIYSSLIMISFFQKWICPIYLSALSSPLIYSCLLISTLGGLIIFNLILI